MARMTKNELLDGLAQYGYVLSKPYAAQEPEKLMEDLLRQEDVRLLEGFPVVLFNAIKEKSPLEWEKERWMPADRLSHKSAARLGCLLSLSYLLFQLYGLESGYLNRTKALLEKFNRSKAMMTEVEPLFLKSAAVRAGGLCLSTERLKRTFRLYFVNAADKHEMESKREELQLELLLSTLFTARQKELLKKKLSGRQFTKTEREYFSRVVKKKLRALANDRLHQLAAGFF